MLGMPGTGSLDSMKRSTQTGGPLNNASSSFAPSDEHPDDSPSEPGLKGSIRGFISVFKTNSNGGKFLNNQFDQKEALANLENLRDVAYQLYKEGNLHLSNFEQGDLESLSHCAKSLCKDSRDNENTFRLKADNLALAINMNLWFQTLLLLKQKRSTGVVKNNHSILEEAKKATKSTPNKTYFNNLGSSLNYLDTTDEKDSNKSVFVYLRSLNDFWVNSSGASSPAPPLESLSEDSEDFKQLKPNFRSVFFKALQDEWNEAKVNGKKSLKNDQVDPSYFNEISCSPGAAAATEAAAEVEAATKIQSVYRGHVTRKAEAEAKAAATKIQSVYRGHVTRNAEAEAKAASTKIQSVYRGHVARNAEAEAKAAATMIQSVYRGHVTRNAEAEATVAATRIQSVYRGHVTRKAEAEAKAAATRIQSVYRGHVTRKAASAEAPSAVAGKLSDRSEGEGGTPISHLRDLGRFFIGELADLGKPMIFMIYAFYKISQLSSKVNQFSEQMFELNRLLLFSSSVNQCLQEGSNQPCDQQEFGNFSGHDFQPHSVLIPHMDPSTCPFKYDPTYPDDISLSPNALATLYPDPFSPFMTTKVSEAARVLATQATNVLSIGLLSGSGLDFSSMYVSSMTPGFPKEDVKQGEIVSSGSFQASQGVFDNPLVIKLATSGLPEPSNVALGQTNSEDPFFDSQSLNPLSLSSLSSQNKNSLFLIACFPLFYLFLLKQALGATRGQLKSTQEKLESTNQSLVTTQDELESTNQALVTTQDELESTQQKLIFTNLIAYFAYSKSLFESKEKAKLRDLIENLNNYVKDLTKIVDTLSPQESIYKMKIAELTKQLSDKNNQIKLLEDFIKKMLHRFETLRDNMKSNLAAS